jgi:hypothetical protein
MLTNGVGLNWKPAPSCYLIAYLPSVGINKELRTHTERDNRSDKWWECGKTIRGVVAPWQVGGGESVFILSVNRVQFHEIH